MCYRHCIRYQPEPDSAAGRGQIMPIIRRGDRPPLIMRLENFFRSRQPDLANAVNYRTFFFGSAMQKPFIAGK